MDFIIYPFLQVLINGLYLLLIHIFCILHIEIRKNILAVDPVRHQIGHYYLPDLVGLNDIVFFGFVFVGIFSGSNLISVQ